MISILPGFLLLFYSCKKEKPNIPVVSTTEVSAISYFRATTGGEVINDGGSGIISMGVCWSIDSEPTIMDSVTIETSESKQFSSIINSLLPNTVYYVRAYATNIAGTGYGDQYEFKTLPVLIPQITTNQISSITGSDAISGGNVTDENGGTIVSRGVCWNTLADPTTSSYKTENGTGTGDFTSLLTGLSQGTTYYVRAYATNSAGTGYGQEQTFQTKGPPVVLTSEISGISYTTARGGGTLTSTGGVPITSSGICWSLSPNPTISDNKTTDGSQSGSFISDLTGLKTSTTYYVRAYATNSFGTSYGNQVFFKTLTGFVSIYTIAASEIMVGGAICGLILTNTTGSPVPELGLCCGTEANPTISSNFKSFEYDFYDPFELPITGLAASTTYYVRAYFNTGSGVSYGNEISFTTAGYGAVSDIDGNSYKTVKIGTQEWMAENLRTTRYLNGDLITTSGPPDWTVSGDTPKYQWPCNGDESIVPVYGRLYTAYTIEDTRKICPTGWHVPSQTEWGQMFLFLGPYDVASKLKEAGTTHWSSPNSDATNVTGFTALPGGVGQGPCSDFGSVGYYWSSTEYNSTEAMIYFMYNELEFMFSTSAQKKLGSSVRCIKD